MSADLIVMGTHRKQLLRDIFVGTTIERVIRTGTWIKAYVEEERRRSTLELEIFMKSLSFDAGTWSHYVAEGDAVPVIAEAIEMVRPDLLVVGTHGRSGMAKVLLGSVAEQLLRALEIDILAVPRGAITA